MKLQRKSDVANEEVVEEVVETVQEEVLNEQEVEAIHSQKEKQEQDIASIERLKLATGIVSSKFNLDQSFRVTNFDDKTKVVKLALENSEFIVNVTIKDSARHGMTVYED